MKDHIKPYLVVARSGASVSDGVGAKRFGISGDGEGLRHSFRADAQGIGSVLQHIAVDKVAYYAVVVVPCFIHVLMRAHAKRLCAIADSGQIVRVEPTGVDGESMDFKTLFLTEVFDAIGCIQTATECKDNFLFHSDCSGRRRAT